MDFRTDQNGVMLKEVLVKVVDIQKYKEHEFIVWIIAMHFLDAIDVALDKIDARKDIITVDTTKNIDDTIHKK